MRITLQQQEEEDKGGGQRATQNKSMSMQEALASAKAERGEPVDQDIHNLQSLNMDSQNPLFEYSTG